jgi:hypothetical protein
MLVECAYAFQAKATDVLDSTGGKCLIYTTTTIIRHKLGLERPVSALHNNIFKSLPGHLHPFGL